VVVLDECSLESPIGEPVCEDDDLCSVVVDGASTAGATTTGAGATTTGAGYATTAGGAEVVVSLELVVSELSANTTPTLPNSTAMPKDKAAVFKECITMMSPLVPHKNRSSSE
jgi:hypothetical protein